jgi:UDP-N-acetylmuramyl pentapeptide phosphotransferase/UDP-N-acetylglucosamine-1-phosphate transferase
MSALVILAVTSFLAGVLITRFIKQRFSQQFLDIPNDRSSHTQPTPRGGGLGFIIAFATTGLIATSLIHPLNPNPLLLFLVLTPLTLVGIIDDRKSLPARLRYLVQLTAASLAIASFQPFPLPWLTDLGIVGQLATLALTLIGITALINFYNFMDGLDGLVASTTAVQLAFLALYLNQPFWWLLVAALLGFLWWNWSPAKIFMGDAGSTVLGASIAIALLNTNDPLQAWSALAITLPLTGDATYTLIRRLLRRENIFKAHRSHLYQRLQQSGWSHAQVAIAYLSATVLIILAISTLGAIGSTFSLLGTGFAIASGELYLKARQQTPDASADSTKIQTETLARQ